MAAAKSRWRRRNTRVNFSGQFGAASLSLVAVDTDPVVGGHHHDITSRSSARLPAATSTRNTSSITNSAENGGACVPVMPTVAVLQRPRRPTRNSEDFAVTGTGSALPVLVHHAASHTYLDGLALTTSCRRSVVTRCSVSICCDVLNESEAVTALLLPVMLQQ